MANRLSRFWRLVRPAGLATAILLVLAWTVQTFQPVRLFALKLGGRVDAACSWHDALYAQRYERARMEARFRVARATRLLAKDGDLLLWESPFGRSWISGAQDIVAARFRAPDLHHWPPRWAEDESRPMVRSGDIVIDCGGHIGESSAKALALGASLVISVEPDPLNAEAIRRNLSHAIKNGRVKVIEQGVWSEEGTLTLERGEASTMSTTHSGVASEHGLRANGRERIVVRVTTIDRLVADLGLPRVDFIKLDIEGAEQDALKGAQDTITRFKPRLAAGAYHNREDRDAIPSIVNSFRPDYEIRSSRCLPAHDRIIPHELFFE